MIKVLVRGAGDLASGVAIAFHRSGFQVLMTEVLEPTVIRRSVSFASCIFDGETEIEGVRAARVEGHNYQEVLNSGRIGVMVDPEAGIIRDFNPIILAIKNLGTSISDAPVVIAAGPGFEAGRDCHLVIETKRGHHLGRPIEHGTAEANSGIPGIIAGRGLERVLYSPVGGIVSHLKEIGDIVGEGEPVLTVSGVPVASAFRGVLRGLIQEGMTVPAGMKIGDVDPRLEKSFCFSISEKAMAVGRGALEGALMLGRRNNLFGVVAFE